MRKPFTIAIRACLSAAALSLLTPVAVAQSAAPQATTPDKIQAKADEHKLPAERGQIVDRIAATVNGELVLESDVEEEERFTRLSPYGDAEGKSPNTEALNRLIDRTLILQQLASFPRTPVTDAEIAKEEADLRKDLPACANADCASDKGWQNFIAAQGFTEDELRDRLRQRVQVLQFIEQRFRSAVRITDKQISDFYTNTMLPQYAKQNAAAPPLDTIHDRVQEVLLQQQVSVMLDEWLKTLRDSGRVRVLKHGEEAP
jgi:peptidyl-prolyl cis-trans isomerase SurA